LKFEIHVEEGRRRVPMEEIDPRMEPHSTLRPPVVGEEDLRGEPLIELCPRRDKMKVEERKWFMGLNTLGRGRPDIVWWHRTLSGRSVQCPLDGLCPQRREKRGFKEF
jgi:hypothetical protein